MRIFMTRAIPDAGLEILKSAADVHVAEDAANRVVSREKVIEGVKAADVLVSLLTEAVDRPVLEAGSGLLGVANYAVGFNNIDVAVATELGLPVTNTPGVLTDTTADLAWTLLMAVARNIVPADNYMRGGRFSSMGSEPVSGCGHQPGRRRSPQDTGHRRLRPHWPGRLPPFAGVRDARARLRPATQGPHCEDGWCEVRRDGSPP